MTPDSTPPQMTPRRLPKPSLQPSVFWRLAEDIPAPLYRRLMLVSVLVPLVAWWLLTTFGQVDAKFLPSPGQVATAALRLGQSGELWQDTWASLRRVGIGFGLSVLVAVPVGVLMGCFQSLRALGEPLFGLMRYMPAPAFIPLLILYLGIDEAPKIALIFIGTFFYNALMVMDTVKFVPKELIEATYMLGGNRVNTVIRVIFPHVLPGILDTCRINFASAWQLVIVAELVAATEGLGRRISLAGRFLRTDEIFVGLMVIGLIGLGLDLFFQYLVRVTCRWAQPE